MSISPSDEQDRAAMERLSGGEDSALEGLMSRHSEKLFHFLVRILQNEARAGDLTEEAFVRVYQNRQKFRPKHRFTTWLYTIATNLARDAHRYEARHPHSSLDAAPEGASTSFHEAIAEARPGPGESLEQLERAEAVRRAVGLLAEELRLPLVLSVYEEKPHAEIAEILDCSVKAVEMRLYRARNELRGLLEREWA